jgi:uncharacterized protein (DUF486 family)
MNIFIITWTWKFNKNIRVMLSRKRRTLHLTGFAYICCFIAHTLHLIFETDALFMVSLVAKPVEFGLSYNSESLGSVILSTCDLAINVVIRILIYNSYMIYIIRNPILWLGISAYGGGVLVSLIFDRRCSPDYFFRNVNKMAACIPDNKKR